MQQHRISFPLLVAIVWLGSTAAHAQPAPRHHAEIYGTIAVLFREVPGLKANLFA